MHKYKHNQTNLSEISRYQGNECGHELFSGIMLSHVKLTDVSEVLTASIIRGGFDWINLAQGKVPWQAFLNIINFWSVHHHV
jgi:hypothetical protein